MIDLFYFNGLPVAVLGLGKSGLSAARALARSGAEVRAWDDDEKKRAAAEAEGIALVDLTASDWSDLTTLVISPGIPHTHPEPHPVARLAREAGCEIICDVELLARAQRNASYLGVTGTNGKSTTTALIGHILRTGGREAEVGGNLGTPALDLEPLDSSGIYVLEMSSYQLELTLSITFDTAVLLNVSPDHLERHGGLDGYIAAKRRIFHRQTRPRSAIIGIDDEICRDIYDGLTAANEQTIVPISGLGRIVGGVYVVDGILTDDSEGKAVQALDLNRLPHLPGSHNWQNAAAAYAACKASGLQPPVITACMESFPGLPHRQELLAVIDGVAYVNDSKATNADAAGKALACYEAVYWILGGRAKESGLTGLEPLFPKVVHAFLIGEAAETFAAQLDGQVPATRCGELAVALEKARDMARSDRRPGAVVLLSPAAASFDQFENFERRGEAFRGLVEALPGTRADLDAGGRAMQ